MLAAEPSQRLSIEDLITNPVMTSYDELLYIDDSPKVSKLMKWSELRSKNYKKHVNLKELSVGGRFDPTFHSGTFSGLENSKVPTLVVTNATFDDDFVKSNTLYVEGRPGESTKLMKPCNRQFSVSSNSLSISGANIGYDPDSLYLRSQKSQLTLSVINKSVYSGQQSLSDGKNPDHCTSIINITGTEDPRYARSFVSGPSGKTSPTITSKKHVPGMGADGERDDGKNSSKATRQPDISQGEFYNVVTSKVGKKSSLFNSKIRKFDTQKSRLKIEESPLSDSWRKYETQVTRKSEKKKSDKYEKLIESNYFDLGESIMNEQFGIFWGPQPQGPRKDVGRTKTILKSISYEEEGDCDASQLGESDHKVFMMKFDTLGQQGVLDTAAVGKKVSMQPITEVIGDERGGETNGGLQNSSRSDDIPDEDPGAGKLNGTRSNRVGRAGVYKFMTQFTSQTK